MGGKLFVHQLLAECLISVILRSLIQKGSNAFNIWWSYALPKMRHGALIERKIWAPQEGDWWIASTFIVGSILFATGAVLPAFARVPSQAILLIYLIGSTLYLVGATVALVHGRHMAIHSAGGPQLALRFANRNSLAATIQVIGAILFQVSATGDLLRFLSPTHHDQVLWVPDLTGAICFVVASAIFFSLQYPIQHRKGNLMSGRTLAVLNIWGSLFFVASAIGDYTPAFTEQALYPVLANVGTFIGALFFLVSSVPGLPLRKSLDQTSDPGAK